MLTRTAHDHYKAAIALRDRIISRQVNDTPVQAWAAVCRECAKANDKFGRENEGRVHGRSQQSFLNNLDRVWWAAKAQVETLARQVA
jgi:hypothetical protein